MINLALYGILLYGSPANDDVIAARAAISRILNASVNSELGRPHLIELNSQDYLVSPIDGLGLYNSSVQASFRSSPLRLFQLNIEIKRPERIDDIRPLELQSIEVIAKNVVKTFVPNWYGVLVEADTPNQAPNPKAPRIGFRAALTLDGVEVQSWWGIHVEIDAYSGCAVNVVNSSAIDYAAFQRPVSWQKAVPDREGFRRAMRAYAATIPFANGWVYREDVVLMVPIADGPAVRQDLTPAHIQGRNERRLMPFFRVIVNSTTEGKERVQQIFVDATTGIPTSVLLIDLGVSVGGSMKKPPLKIEPGLELDVVGTTSKITIDSRCEKTTDSKATIIAYFQAGRSTLRGEFDVKAKIISIDGTTWRYDGSPDLVALKKLKPLGTKT